MRYNDGMAKKCGQCGGELRRVHRTFIERFTFMAKYHCVECRAVETAPRTYRYLGDRCRCHRCGTYRISKLKVRDKIDKMETGFLNLLERCMGGTLYHCRYCRVQFFDRRTFIPAVARPPRAKGNETPLPPTDEPGTATPNEKTALHLPIRSGQ
jgi:hypothetical protein